MKTFHLIISSVTETKFDDDVVSLYVSGVDGELEVLADHEPLIATLKAGTITIKTENDEEKFSVEKGILEVANNRAVALV